MIALRRAVGVVLAASTAAVLGTACAPTRGLESIGGYVDDSAITSTVKARLAEDPAVSAEAIQVETTNGNVVLSGVAGDPVGKSSAELLAIKVRGVKTVQNNLVVRR